jgi:hypothetical protein
MELPRIILGGRDHCGNMMAGLSAAAWMRTLLEAAAGTTR